MFFLVFSFFYCFHNPLKNLLKYLLFHFISLFSLGYDTVKDPHVYDHWLSGSCDWHTMSGSMSPSMEHQEMPVSCGGHWGQQQWEQWYPGPGSGQEAKCEVLAGAWPAPRGGHCGHCRHCRQHSLHPRQVRSSLPNPGIMRTSWQAWYLHGDHGDHGDRYVPHLQLTLPDVHSVAAVLDKQSDTQCNAFTDWG